MVPSTIKFNPIEIFHHFVYLGPYVCMEEHASEFVFEDDYGGLSKVRPYRTTIFKMWKDHCFSKYVDWHTVV